MPSEPSTSTDVVDGVTRTIDGSPVVRHSDEPPETNGSRHCVSTVSALASTIRVSLSIVTGIAGIRPSVCAEAQASSAVWSAAMSPVNVESTPGGSASHQASRTGSSVRCHMPSAAATPGVWSSQSKTPVPMRRP